MVPRSALPWRVRPWEAAVSWVEEVAWEVLPSPSGAEPGLASHSRLAGEPEPEVHQTLGTRSEKGRNYLGSKSNFKIKIK